MIQFLDYDDFVSRVETSIKEMNFQRFNEEIKGRSITKLIALSEYKLKGMEQEFILSTGCFYTMVTCIIGWFSYACVSHYYNPTKETSCVIVFLIVILLATKSISSVMFESDKDFGKDTPEFQNKLILMLRMSQE